jgi:mRNA interferase RelE/StbE
MKYRVLYSKGALKQLKKLDKPAARMIVKYMQDIEKLDDPRVRGKQLSGNLAEFWRYKVSDYRILCKIQDNVLVIFVVEVGNRKEVYN